MRRNVSSVKKQKTDPFKNIKLRIFSDKFIKKLVKNGRFKNEKDKKEFYKRWNLSEKNL